jgi:ribosomal protein S18 acetylase RimI-like enzyme
LKLLNFRLAVVDDLNVLLQLNKEFCEIDNHEFNETRIKNAFLPLLLNTQLGVVILLELESEITGYAVLTWGWSIESGGREGLIDEIYISKRNSGLGAALLSEVIKVAKESDVKKIFLETELANERVRNFYQRHGFEKESSIWLSHDISN